MGHIRYNFPLQKLENDKIAKMEKNSGHFRFLYDRSEGGTPQDVCLHKMIRLSCFLLNHGSGTPIDNPRFLLLSYS